MQKLESPVYTLTGTHYSLKNFVVNFLPQHPNKNSVQIVSNVKHNNQYIYYIHLNPITLKVIKLFNSSKSPSQLIVIGELEITQDIEYQRTKGCNILFVSNHINGHESQCLQCNPNKRKNNQESIVNRMVKVNKVQEMRANRPNDLSVADLLIIQSMKETLDSLSAELISISNMYRSLMQSNKDTDVKINKVNSGWLNSIKKFIQS